MKVVVTRVRNTMALPSACGAGFDRRARGAKATIDLARVMTRRLTITGSTLRPRTIAEKAAIADQLRTHIWPLIRAGSLSPFIDSVFPLERVADAHRRLESGAHIGKVVLTM